jgi:hypothetical protein
MEIILGVAYPIDPKREIKMRLKDTVKSVTFTWLKEQKL